MLNKFKYLRIQITYKIISSDMIGIDWTANRAYQRHNEVKTQLPLGTDSVPNGDVVDDTYASLDSSSEHEDYEMHRSQEADLKTGDSHVNPVYESHDNL